MQFVAGLLGGLIGAAAALAGQVLADHFTRRRERASALRDATKDFLACLQTTLSVLRTGYMGSGNLDTASLSAVRRPLAAADVDLNWLLEDSGLSVELLRETDEAWQALAERWHEASVKECEELYEAARAKGEVLRTSVGVHTRPAPRRIGNGPCWLGAAGAAGIAGGFVASGIGHVAPVLAAVACATFIAAAIVWPGRKANAVATTATPAGPA